MTSTALAAAVATPPSVVVPSVAFRASVPLRTVDSPANAPGSESGPGGGGGRLLRRKEFVAEANNRTASLKTLSCDLSEILVKNLSLKRSETSTERRPQPPDDGTALDELPGIISAGLPGTGGPAGGAQGANGTGTGVPYGSGGNARHSLCDTFTSVNKLIKLKRVSSDGSNLSRFSSVVATTGAGGGGANYTRIVELPAKQQLQQQAPTFKRVEISVRERTPNSHKVAATGGSGAPTRCSGVGGGGVAVGPSPAEPPLSESDEADVELPVLTHRKAGGVIVNQLDQVDETCPLLGNGGGDSAPTITLRKKEAALVFTRKRCDESGSRPPLPVPEDDAVPKVVLRRRVRLSDWRPGARAAEQKLDVKRRSLQWPIGGRTAEILESEGGAHRRREGRAGAGDSTNGGSRLRHSWNAPGYDILEEDPSGAGGAEGDLGKDFASIFHNLAGLRSHHLANGTHESVSLLEQHSPQIVPSRASRPTSLVGTGGTGRRGGPASWMHSSPMVPTSGSAGAGGGDGGNAESSPHSGSVLSGGPVPRKRRFEAFLKNLVGRRPSKEPPPPAAPPPPPVPPLLPSPEIKISKSPSEHNLAEITRSRLNISTTSLSSVHQKLWSVVPLLKRDVSCASLASPKTTPLLLDTSQVSSSGARCGTSGGGGAGGGLGCGGAAGGMRKCETVLALTGSSSSSSASQTLEPIRPLNRLRNCASVATCSRCSSLLSLAAAGSRYSLNASNGAFVSVSGQSDTPDAELVAIAPKSKKGHHDATHGGSSGSGSKRKHVGNLLRLTTTSCSSSSSSSAASSPCSSSTPSSSSSSSSSSPTTPNNAPASPASVAAKVALLLPSPAQPVSPIATGATTATTTTTTALTPTVKFTCKLCLGEFSAENLTRITQCACSFCTECMTAYVEFEISEGAYEVSCPDAQCPAQGIITIAEITALASSSLVEKHHRYRLNREVELDRFRTWCPKAGCETICLVGPAAAAAAAVEEQQQQKNQSLQTSCSDRIVPLSPSSSSMPSPCAVHCPTCREDFCSGCKKAWHPTMSCEENSRRLAVDGQADALGIPFDNDLIKCCPMCTVPIEKDEGCAQMMCKRCKHVFCWYCLASLDDDFLLRHYDKGPCKNKLGHSRASVVWHRAQVIGIFAGFGILLLVASPLLLLAAPCIVCCKCRICSGAAKLEETEVDYDDAAVALHSTTNTTTNPR